MDADEVVSRTRRYLGTPAVVGFEDPFLDVLEAELVTAGRTIQRTSGVLAATGPGPAVISAHVDRHGLITTDTDQLAYAAHDPPGSHRPLTARTAATICRRFDREEVVAYDPTTGAPLGTGTVAHSEHCGIGIGLDLIADGLPRLPAGTPVAFAPQVVTDGGWIRGQLDNALSAAILMELIRAGFAGTALFTCGEEAGRSWEGLLAVLPERTNQLVVLDTSPFDTSDEAERGVVVLRHRDAGGHFDPDRTTHLAAAAQTSGVEIVWKDTVLEQSGRPLGRTELGRLIAATGGDVTGSTLQIPTSDYHSNFEATTTGAIAATLATLTAYVAAAQPT